MSKIVQGFNNEPYFLDENLQIIFNEMKLFDYFNKHLINIIFRNVDNNIMIVLHIPSYSLDDYYEIIKFPWLEYNIVTLQIHYNKHFCKSFERITIFGKEIRNTKLENAKDYISFSNDSFLQPNLKVCSSMYNDIEKIIRSKYEKIPEIIGFGDDTLNISKYLGYKIFSYLHCEYNLKVCSDEFRKGTTSLTEFSKIQSADILIITPGRKGLSKKEKEIIYNIDVPYIIYIACKPETLEKDITDSYVILYTKVYNMYLNKDVSNKYSETVQLWNKIHHFSIGEDCCVQYHLNKKCSYYSPFSWCKTMNFETILYLLENNFEELITKIDSKDIIYYKSTNKHAYIQYDEMSDDVYDISDNMIIRINIHNNYIEFPHDIRNNIEYYDLDLENLKEKIIRRSRRLYDNRYYRIFYRYSSKPNQITPEMVSRIYNYCDKLVIITSKPEKITFVETIKDNGGHSSWKRELLEF